MLFETSVGTVLVLFKQKTAYEVLRSLVGSEMCIRDRMTSTALAAQIAVDKPGAAAVASYEAGLNYGLNVICLL